MDYYPLSDLLYRSVALTDDNADVVEAYDTDAYGNTLIFDDPGPDEAWFTDDDVTTDAPLCPFIFTGRRYDPETEIYFYRARYYQPQLGRFLSRDPIRYVDGMGLYEYVGSCPSARKDHAGMSWKSFWTIGEVCQFTGKSQVQPKDFTIPISDSVLDYLFGGGRARKTRYYCQCEICCRDYDWDPCEDLDTFSSLPPFRFSAMVNKGEWVPDPDNQWCEWVSIDQRDEYKSMDDERRARAKAAGMGFRLVVRAMVNPSGEDGYGSTLEDTFVDVWGYMAEDAVDSQYRYESEQGWAQAKAGRIAAFEATCAAKCRSRAGSDY